MAAATGHAYIQAGNHPAARAALTTTALDQLPPTACRARVLVLVDLVRTRVPAALVLRRETLPPTILKDFVTLVEKH
ncbi:MAG: hypothetical protein ACRDTH_27965 [Pseudonocardiaceae bacterium]